MVEWEYIIIIKKIYVFSVSLNQINYSKQNWWRKSNPQQVKAERNVDFFFRLWCLSLKCKSDFDWNSSYQMLLQLRKLSYVRRIISWSIRLVYIAFWLRPYVTCLTERASVRLRFIQIHRSYKIKLNDTNRRNSLFIPYRFLRKMIIISFVNILHLMKGNSLTKHQFQFTQLLSYPSVK